MPYRCSDCEFGCYTLLALKNHHKRTDHSGTEKVGLLRPPEEGDDA